MTTVTERGTYYLYSSKDEHKPLYQTELRKGDALGFKVSGNHIRAIAKVVGSSQMHVSRVLRRALDRLREAIDEEG